MAEPKVNLFGVPPGLDFAAAVIDGLLARHGAGPPEELARTTIFVNTARLQRRVRTVLQNGPARLLPRIRLVTDLAGDPGLGDPAPARSALERHLELARLVAGVIEVQPDLAPASAVFDLARSLGRLIDEMHGEGVPAEALRRLDVADQSGHWARTLKFLDILGPWIAPDAGAAGAELRLRRAVEALSNRWRDRPTTDRIVVAGSTGSRGSTAMLMDAVARLPNGAVILPGYDDLAPGDVWDILADGPPAEDHPQYRYAAICRRLGVSGGAIAPWTAAPAPDPARNAVLSLALRPAPVTDRWHREGPALGSMRDAMAHVTLLEAESPRDEAETIALRLRHAIDEGVTAILITPDRMLTRQVAAALDRWHIVADDSAGTPLHQSPPGRLLRHLAGAMSGRLTAEALLSILKHPLASSGGADRGPHLLMTRDLELWCRRRGLPFPDRESLLAWAAQDPAEEEGRRRWLDWLWGALSPILGHRAAPMSELLAAHLAAAEALAAGPDAAGAGALWEEAAGRRLDGLMSDLRAVESDGAALSAIDYSNLLHDLMSAEEVRDRDKGDGRILFRGTLEARIEPSDLVILAGLADGVWPPTPAPDPWLNRPLRQAAGLLSPDRSVGLSAHDFQIAAAAPEIWLTRSLRTMSAETVPSRWLNRIVNLVGGLHEQEGGEALAEMRARGAQWVRRAHALRTPEGEVPRAARPSPRVHRRHRPTRYSVSDITTLIRDPYAVYARRILRLRPLDPLGREATAAEKGTLLHEVFERFVRDGPPPDDPRARPRLIAIAEEVLAAACPWPTVRHLWMNRVDSVADWFLLSEVARRKRATPSLFERTGTREIPALGVTVTAKADRIDLSDAGAWIYDYKTGKPPSPKAQKAFEKQLLIEAAILEGSGWSAAADLPVLGAEYIGLGTSPAIVPAPLDEITPAQTWADVERMMEHWLATGRGYSARIAPARISFDGDYDHLARRGEWADSDRIRPEDIGS